MGNQSKEKNHLKSDKLIPSLKLLSYNSNVSNRNRKLIPTNKNNEIKSPKDVMNPKEVDIREIYEEIQKNNIVNIQDINKIKNQKDDTKMQKNFNEESMSSSNNNNITNKIYFKPEKIIENKRNKKQLNSLNYNYTKNSNGSNAIFESKTRTITRTTSSNIVSKSNSATAKPLLSFEEMVQKYSNKKVKLSNFIPKVILIYKSIEN